MSGSTELKLLQDRSRELDSRLKGYSEYMDIGSAEAREYAALNNEYVELNKRIKQLLVEVHNKEEEGADDVSMCEEPEEEFSCAQNDFMRAVDLLMVQIQADIFHCINQAWIRLREQDRSNLQSYFAENASLEDRFGTIRQAVYFDPEKNTEDLVPFIDPPEKELQQKLEDTGKLPKLRRLFEKYNSLVDVSVALRENRDDEAVTLAQTESKSLANDVSISKALHAAWYQFKDALRQFKDRLFKSSVRTAIPEIKSNGKTLYGPAKRYDAHKAFLEVVAHERKPAAARAA